MPLDPQVKQMLEERARSGVSGMGESSKGPYVYRTEERSIFGPTGKTFPIRMYTPLTEPPYAGVLFMHPGGWTAGSIENSDGQARSLAAGAGCVVVNVGYSLAPDAKFPTQVEQCYAALQWLVKHAEDYSVDVNRIGVAGASAGGNLAAALALMARDRKGPHIACQVLIYPVTNCDFTTRSNLENGGGAYGITTERMKAAWEAYLTKPEDALNPYAAPMQAKDLAGLPQALVQTAEYDPLRDEGEIYAAKMRQAGVHVQQTRYNGLNHGFFGQFGRLDKAKDAVTEACEFLKEHLARR